MKKFNIKLIGIFLALISVALVSCDEESTEKENSFKYDGKTYKIANGYLENFGLIETSYNLDLILMTSGITYNSASGEPSGEGSYLYFEMFSSSSTQLNPGTYNFDYYTWNAGTFDYAEIGVNVNFATEAGTYLSIVAGTVKVKLTDTKYEITIDCTLENNKKVTGYYKGTLNYIIIETAKSPIEKIFKK